MIISIFTGFAAGAVHVVGGADHLVAMAPAAFSKPKLALKNSFAWGLGHSTGVLCLSGMAILIKDFVQIERLSNFAELSVGIFLLAVGVLTIQNGLGLRIHAHNHNHGDGNQHQHIHLHVGGRKKQHIHSHTSASLGVLHGLAGASHLLAVIPALALPPLGGIFYLLFYLLGSICTMGLLVLVMSIATFRISKNIMSIIFGATGSLSIFMGCFWIHKTSSFLL